MNICEHNKNCPYVDECEYKIEVTTYEDSFKGVRRFIKSMGECDMSKTEIQEYVQKLENENACLKNENDMLMAKCKEHEDKYWARIDELENQHQVDCITINQLDATIDTLVNKLARLRESKGL